MLFFGIIPPPIRPMWSYLPTMNKTFSSLSFTIFRWVETLFLIVCPQSNQSSIDN